MLQTALTAARNGYHHDLSGRAAQIAFYSLLAIFPALITLVGLLAVVGVGDEVEQLFDLIRGSVPSETMDLLQAELRNLEHHSGKAIAFSIALAIYYGSKALNGALHGAAIAYSGHQGQRAHLNLFSVAASGVLLLGMFSLVGILTALGPMLRWVQSLSMFPSALVELLAALRWPIVALAFQLAVAGVYWLGAHQKRFRPWSAGSLAATTAWLCLSLGYERVARGIGQLGATYGSLAASIGLLLYLHTLASCVLLGAELDGARDR